MTASRRLSSVLAAVILAAAALGCANVSAAEPLSFEAARARFHERADIFRADTAEVDRARHAADSAKALSGPKVDVTVMHVEGRKDINLEVDTPAMLQGLGSRFGLSVPSTMAFGTEYDLSGPRAVLSATWPIYTGGAITAQQDALEGKVREAAAARTARLEEKDAELVARYWGVQLARSVEALRRSVLADEEEQVHRALRFEKKGLISRIERMSVEVSRDTARRELIAAETSARVAESELMSALREKSLPELSTPLFILTGDLGTLSEWQARARANSPVLTGIDAQRDQAEQGVKAAKSAYHPQVFAFGMKNLVKHYLTPVEPDWMAGIGVKFTLWDNRDRYSALAASKSLVTKAEAARAEADNALATAVEVAFLRSTQAREEYDLTSSTVALAQENLRLRESSFGEGLSTALDVREARTQLTGAQIAQRAAAYKFVVAWAMLHASAGVMPDFSNAFSRADFRNAQ
ncbi:TolC family protein [Sutterella sp.]|uniref:TolC family protein n=1 Tax=Sutterella sp. TaxID=1981025 RepID=UPI0026DFBBFA|nr:TolC family protein [Sutterella sp.]MDO5530891.1 TolC family protein [Sutterella sp.]